MAVRPLADKSSRMSSLERLPGYWRGRALGRAMATDSPELGKDRLADQRAIAEYERKAEAMKNEPKLQETSA